MTMAMTSFYNLSHEQIGTATYFEMTKKLVPFKLSRKYLKAVINLRYQKLETLNFTVKHTICDQMRLYGYDQLL
jgi:hypothetical protein